MSLPGDDNPNPQWQPSQEPPKWSSGSPLGDDGTTEPAAEQAPPQWQQAPPQEQQWQQRPPQWEQPAAAQVNPGWVPAPRTPGKAVAALVLGIVGLVLCPVIPSILALVFGYQSKNEIDRAQGGLGGRGLALTGIVLGWIAVGLWALLFVVIAIGAAAGS